MTNYTCCRYSSSVYGSLRSIDQLLLAYGPQPSFDDMAWYGLAYFRCSNMICDQIISWLPHTVRNSYIPGSMRCPGERSIYSDQKIYLTGWLITLTLLIIFKSFICWSVFLILCIWRDIVLPWCENTRCGLMAGTMPHVVVGSGLIRWVYNLIWYCW